MLIITAITAAAVTLLLAYLLVKVRRTDNSQLLEPRASFVTVGVQIICGDCAGDEETPRKTLLDRFGACLDCGGQSYILASIRGFYLMNQANQAFTAGQIAPAAGRVLAFSGRSSRAEKIAV